MEIGIYCVCTRDTLRPDELARLVEDAGFDAIAFGEQTHMTGAQIEQGGDLVPPEYRELFDLPTALMAAAVVTTRIRIEASILQLPWRDPILLAKALATIDVLSGGRLDVIVGTGWSEEQIRNHGYDFAERHFLMEEKVRAIQHIFRAEPATFHGEYVHFDDAYVSPKPVQPGGVPILRGGFSEGAGERALDLADGWGTAPWPGMRDRVAAFTAENPGFPVHVVSVEPERRALVEWAGSGASRIIVDLGVQTSREEAVDRLGEIRELVDTVAWR